VDFVLDPPTQDVARLRADPGVRIIEGGELRVQYIAFDVFRDDLLYGKAGGRNPFKDLRVRQAVAHAIDAEAIRAKVMRGFRAGGSSHAGVQGYAAEADRRLPHDRRSAQAAGRGGLPQLRGHAGRRQPPAAADIAGRRPCKMGIR
jgi:peptide/nickel transport system substrate-binding protein